MSAAMDGQFPAFSLHDGGPFYRLMVRLHLLRASGRIRGVWLAFASWLPLVIGEVVRIALGMQLDPTLLDLSVHVRLLVAVPIMLFAERWVEPACASAIHSLYVGSFCDRSALDRIVARGEHLRDAWWPEALLFVLALIGGQLAFWNVSGPTGLFHGQTGVGEWSFPHVWYAMVALPLAQFVMLRWLWRWMLWSGLLVAIARLPMRPLSTHPDQAAGLACLARPMSGFSGFAFGLGSILASAWGTQMLARDASIRAMLPGLLVFVFAVLAIAIAPLLLFCGHLYRARRRALAQYGDFAMEYVRGFHAKWIEAGTGDQALGSSDIQALNDLGGAYGVISSTRLFVFGLRSIAMVWSAALVPMIPLFANLLTVEQILARIVRTVLGGIPL
jgi:hypothetical protein